ncbi:MAG TPA: hypothetical protein VE998_09050 [Terriglobales bacterium]|nr:hypothetical protein [Terriglobales bacterium]
MKSIERQLRYLKIYSVVLTIALITVGLGAFQSAPRRQHFAEVDIERVNIVEPDGKLVMTISDLAHAPDAVLGGKTAKRQGGNSPGFIFYNQQGDEDGGLYFHGGKNKDGSSAGGGLLFDQYQQDQTIGIQYGEENGRRSAAFHVWDRPDTPLVELMPKIDEVVKLPAGPQRDAAIKSLRDSGQLGAQRVFLGKNPDRSAALLLADSKGQPRLRASVDAAGNPKLEFLDDAGKVLYSLPPVKP